VLPVIGCKRKLSVFLFKKGVSEGNINLGKTEVFSILTRLILKGTVYAVPIAVGEKLLQGIRDLITRKAEIIKRAPELKPALCVKALGTALAKKLFGSPFAILKEIHVAKIQSIKRFTSDAL
jgi:hypothetical protein